MNPWKLVASLMTQPFVSLPHVYNHSAIPAERANRPTSPPFIRGAAAIIKDFSKWPPKKKRLLQPIIHIARPIGQKVVNNSTKNPRRLKPVGLLNSAKGMIVKDHFRISVKHAKII